MSNLESPFVQVLKNAGQSRGFSLELRGPTLRILNHATKISKNRPRSNLKTKSPPTKAGGLNPVPGTNISPQVVASLENLRPKAG
jgi:hypothetical protein